MEKNELISVVIPVYNVEPYLRECVDSVLAQTYLNYEIILVDDGSTDDSGAICDAYSKNYEKVRVIHQENRGLSEARNNGCKNARGAYIYFLDSDDWIDPDALELMLDKAVKGSADIVFFDAVSFEDKTKALSENQTYIRHNTYCADRGINVFAELQKNREFRSVVYLLLIKKEFIDANGLSFYPGIVYEDLLYTLKAFCLADRVVYLPKHFYHRRYRQGSITKSKKTKKNYISIETVFYEVFKFIKDSGLDENEAVKQYLIRCAFSAVNIFDDLEYEDKRLCKNNAYELKKIIRSENAFGSKVLYARCYGKLPWAFSRLLEKAHLLP